MNALHLFSSFVVVVGCHASLLPASTLSLTHAGHLPAFSSYAPHTLSHHAHTPVVAPYSLGHHHSIAPAVQTTQHHSQDELGQYEFGYSGGPSSRHETGDGYGGVRGSYSYVDGYGQVQSQSYIADDLGFRVVGTNLPTTGHHHLGKRSITFPASTGPLAVGHHVVAPLVHAAHHVAPVVHTAPYALVHQNSIAPAVQTTQHHSQNELGQYEFGYSGGPSSRHETGDAYGNVQGSYSYVDGYGQVQSQSYIADDLGFRVVGTNLPATGHHHLGKRSFTFPASTGPLAVGHHVVAPVVNHAQTAHHVGHISPVAHAAHSHQATHYTIPGAHVSHVATHPSHGYGYGHNNGAFSYTVSAAAPIYGYAQNHYAHAGHY